MFYPEQVIEDVRSGNDIVSVVSSYVKLTPRGANHFGLCPFHSEKTPSFSVSADKQIYYCFGCGAGGNVISFIMQVESLGFQDALKLLAERIHYALPEDGNAEEAAKLAKKRELIYEMNKKAARFFYDMLASPSGAAAAAYLDKREVHPQMRVKYGLGYAPGKKSLTRMLQAEGYSKEALEMSGLVANDKKGGFYDRFMDRLMFPIFDATGRITGFGGRVLAEGSVKYLNSPETLVFDKSRSFYSINFAKASKAREFILVEGYMDVISLCQAGFTQAVAALGTAFNASHAATLKRFCDSVIVLFDSDQAGTKAALRAFPFLQKANLGVKALQVTGAKDPDEYIKKNGAAAFAELLKTAKSHYAFQILQLKGGFDMSDISEKVKFASEAAKVISTIDSAIEREAHEKEIAELSGISRGAISSEVGKLLHGAPHPRQSISLDAPSSPDGAVNAKRGLAYFAATDEPICKALMKSLNPSDMGDGIYQRLLAFIYKRRQDGKACSPSILVDDFDDIAQKRLVSELFTRNAGYERMEDKIKAIEEMLKVVKTAALDAEIMNLRKELLTIKQNDPTLLEKMNKIQELSVLRRNIDKLHISTSDG